MLKRRPSPAMLVGLLSLFISLGGVGVLAATAIAECGPDPALTWNDCSLEANSYLVQSCEDQDFLMHSFWETCERGERTHEASQKITEAIEAEAAQHEKERRETNEHARAAEGEAARSTQERVEEELTQKDQLELQNRILSADKALEHRELKTCRSRRRRSRTKCERDARRRYIERTESLI